MMLLPRVTGQSSNLQRKRGEIIKKMNSTEGLNLPALIPVGSHRPISPDEAESHYKFPHEIYRIINERLKKKIPYFALSIDKKELVQEIMDNKLDYKEENMWIHYALEQYKKAGWQIGIDHEVYIFKSPKDAPTLIPIKK